MPHDTIIVLDYGGQTAQLIARRVREIGVYSEIHAWNTPPETILALNPKGLILSGGPSSVYDEGAPTLPRFVTDSGLPVLGICYGMHLLSDALGGKVTASHEKEFGPATIAVEQATPLWAGLPDPMPVWMSHGDRTDAVPPGFVPLAHSDNSPIAAMGDTRRCLYGIQFHPEVTHTPDGLTLLRNFAIDVCGCVPDWDAGHMLDEIVASVRAQVGSGRVLLALSGGVDSSVVAAILHKAIGDQLVSVFIDHGMLRLHEADQVIETFKASMGLNLVAVNAIEDFLGALDGITDPETKRKIIGETFVRIFERESTRLGALGEIEFLAQGTIYPDVIESAASGRPSAMRIKSHHNVGGLPENMKFKLVEPLRGLFKDEVRTLGEALGLPEQIVWRQPFPGPGLAVRCLGEITQPRLDRLREADAIFVDELRAAGKLRGETAQAFAVLLPVRSVGVMGDGRTYGETIALRAVTTDDFMTADWARIPYDLLARASSRIVNEVAGISRVVYDVTSKPPATIEWE